MTDTARTDAVRALTRLSRLLERACPDLSLAHYRVLAAVADGDERATRVADRLALGKPTISAAIDSLCGRGLLERTGVDGDGRASTLLITADGRSTLQRAEAAMLARLDEVLGRTERADDARDALVRLAAGLDAWRADRDAAARDAAAHRHADARGARR